jgi:cytochrome c556
MSAPGRQRLYLAIIVLLLVVITAMAWKFIVAGSTQKASDGRTVILLAPAERALMLTEMRGFVAGLGQITDGLARDDMPAIAAASRALGTAKAHDVPMGMLAKLPLEFKKLAFAVHGGFDAIARDAEAVHAPKHTLGQLAGVLSQCAACHERYRVSAEAADTAPR